MSDYLKNIQKAVNYIEDNLKNKIKLVDVAKEACLSMYHFHRVFKAIVGESSIEYMRKRRLSSASIDLLETNKNIIDIAFDYMFESHEAFSRSFKDLFKISPAQFRKNRKKLYLFNKRKLTFDKLLHIKKGLTIKPEITTINSFKVIGIRFKTTLKENKIPEMWNKLLSRINEINHTIEFMGYGICENEPDFDILYFDDQTVFSEIVSICVTKIDNIPDGMVNKTIPGGKYAVFTHKGKADFIPQTYDYIYSTWLLKNKYELDNRDDFEFYDERFKGPDNEESEIDIYIPIK